MRENGRNLSHVEVPDTVEVQSTLQVRLRSLAEALPEQGFVTLSRDALFEMIDDRGQVNNAEQYSVDLTVAEVAGMFDRRPQTIRDWIKKGALRGYKLSGREYRITETAVKEFQECERNGKVPRKQFVEADLGAWRQV